MMLLKLGTLGKVAFEGLRRALSVTYIADSDIFADKTVKDQTKMRSARSPQPRESTSRY